MLATSNYRTSHSNSTPFFRKNRPTSHSNSTLQNADHIQTQHHVPHITVKLNKKKFWLEKTLNLFHQINFMKVQVKHER